MFTLNSAGATSTARRQDDDLPGWIPLAAFAGVALILALCVLLGSHILASGHDKSDESVYLYFAQNLRHGRYALTSQQQDGVFLWHSPGFPLVLVPITALHPGITVVRMIGPASLTLAGVFFWRLLRRWLSPWLALAGGVALALFPPYLRLMPQLFSEPTALMFLMAAWLALAKAYETNRLRWAITSGLLAGWMVLVRGDDGWVLLVAIAVVAMLAALKRRRSDVLNLVSLCIALLVCLPWLLYTESLAHRFPYWESSGGESLYWMASTTQGSTGAWESAQTALVNPRFVADRALFRRLAPLPQSERDSELTTAALRLIRQHPGVYAQHVVDNVGRMILDIPYDFLPAGSGLLLYGFFDVAVLVLLVVAIVVLRRPPGSPIPALVKLMVVFAMLNFLIHVPVAAYPRMAMLSIPAALAVIGLAAERILSTLWGGNGTTSAHYSGG